MSSPATQDTYRFGAFTLSTVSRRLSRDGTPVDLGGRAFDILLQLVRQPGQVVSKPALLGAVWEGRAVEQNNLTVQMSGLRRVLGADASGQPLIRTVPGQGYVFAGEMGGTPEPTPAPPPDRLPLPPSSFIGRESELSDVRDLMDAHRLVTVLGIGGIGKTRLALQAASELAPGFRDGARLIDLAPITDPRWLAHGLATACGAGEGVAEAALVAALRRRHMLLLLDNAEHLTAALAPLLRTVLAGCPDVSILVTSRTRLGIPGESVFRLQPLSAPPPGRGSAETAMRFDAVRLFVERATALIPGFRLRDAEADAVSAICRRLDGIALAIETAVPRLQVLTPQQIADRLDQRFHLLPPLNRDTAPRQRTLREMFDWSWELLDFDEAALLQRLALFAGSASLRALVALSADGTTEWDVLDRLTELVEKSLVVTEGVGHEPRYRLLETTRLYALDRLGNEAEARLRRAHGAYFVSVLEQAEAEWPTTRDVIWLDRYGADADNVRAALKWAFESKADPDAEALGLRLVAASYPLWWDLPGLPLREGRRWFDLAVQRIRPDTPAITAARLWFGHSWRDARFGDTENFPSASRAVGLFRGLDDPVGLGAALWRAGNTMLTAETADIASRDLEESERVLRTVPPTKFLALCLVKRADLLLRQGALDDAYAKYNEAMRIIRAIGHWYGLMTCASNMADLLLMRGDPERALHQLESTRDELPRELRSPHSATLAAHLALAGRWEAAHAAAYEVALFAPATGLAGALGWIAETLGVLCIEAGQPQEAARLAGYARRVHPSTATRAGARRDIFLRLDAALAAGLPAPERTRLEQEGAEWSDTEAADAVIARAEWRTPG